MFHEPVILLGPSSTFYCDPKGSLQALTTACRLLSEGFIEAALVGGSSHILFPSLSLQYIGLEFLSPDGLSRAFDKSGNLIFLQGINLFAIVGSSNSVCDTDTYR